MNQAHVAGCEPYDLLDLTHGFLVGCAPYRFTRTTLLVTTTPGDGTISRWPTVDIADMSEVRGVLFHHVFVLDPALSHSLYI